MAQQYRLFCIDNTNGRTVRAFHTGPRARRNQCSRRRIIIVLRRIIHRARAREDRPQYAEDKRTCYYDDTHQLGRGLFKQRTHPCPSARRPRAGHLSRISFSRVKKKKNTWPQTALTVWILDLNLSPP